MPRHHRTRPLPWHRSKRQDSYLGFINWLNDSSSTHFKVERFLQNCKLQYILFFKNLKSFSIRTCRTVSESMRRNSIFGTSVRVLMLRKKFRTRFLYQPHKPDWKTWQGSRAGHARGVPLRTRGVLPPYLETAGGTAWGTTGARLNQNVINFMINQQIIIEQSCNKL